MLKATNINGTSLQGYVRTTFAELVEQFGAPHMEDGDKTTVEWAFNVGGIVFTIYDYKTYGTPKNEYDWHIGGREENVLHIVEAIFPKRVRGYRD